MSDPGGRAFWRTLTAALAVFALLTVGAVTLFGVLLFRTLSRDVMEEALVNTRQDAEKIARGVAERSRGDIYTLTTRQTEIDDFVGSSVSNRRVLNEVKVLDKTGKLVYQFRSQLSRPEPDPGRGPEGQTVSPVVPGAAFGAAPRSYETSVPVQDPYDIEVPVGDFGVLRVGLSRREMERRVEALREKLYVNTAAAAAFSLLGIGAAGAALILLYRHNQRVEEARLEAERRAELGEVAAGLAHEIRNPLNAMGLNLELLEEALQKGGARSASAGDLAQSARLETERLARMLNDFLSYARPSPLSPVPGDLNEPAGEAVAFLGPEAERRRIRLEFSPSPVPALTLLDAARVKQVVLNLVANALDAVESEGALSREVDVKVEESGDSWRLSVSDRGPGIPAGKVAEIFKLFVSTKPAGTGLGLPIAQRIVRAHGGALNLTSGAEGTLAVATFPKRKG